MTRMILMAATLALGVGAARADTLTERIRSDLENQGYKDIEIDRKDGRIEVEAMRGNQEVELVYDGATGELVSRDDDRTTGLEPAEQVSGKELPASGQNDRADDESDGDDNRGQGRGSDHTGGNGNSSDNGNGGSGGNGRN